MIAWKGRIRKISAATERKRNTELSFKKDLRKTQHRMELQSKFKNSRNKALKRKNSHRI